MEHVHYQLWYRCWCGLNSVRVALSTMTKCEGWLTGRTALEG